MLTGGCYCGYIRYEATGTPAEQTQCHCSICRRTTGGTLVAWFSVPKSMFQWLSGHPARFNSSEQAERCFCPRCGTQLTFESSDSPEVIDITITSLDDPERVPPRDHTWTSARLSWVRMGDGLPEYREKRDG